MKILSASQIREADNHTIQHEPIASINLMERASVRFVEWFVSVFDITHHIHVFCGTGSNGGDGLAIARLLKGRGYHISAAVIRVSDKESQDFSVNYDRIHDRIPILEITTSNNFPEVQIGDVIIDGLFGSGLSRPLEGLFKEVVERINSLNARVVAIDIPSGMSCDEPIQGSAGIKALYTVSFQVPKLAFFLPSNLEFIGHWQIVDIGLDQEFISSTKTTNYAITDEEIASLIKVKKPNDHKGSNGRAMLIAGSYGKMGAAVLAGRAAMRSGVGLLTIHSPHCGYDILQTSVPEAMISPDSTEYFFGELPNLDKFDAIGIGPGLDTKSKTVKAFEGLFNQWTTPIVIDADGLNILAENRHLLPILPRNSILTPHHGEFERLAGSWNNDLERIKLQKEFSHEFNVHVLFKGPATTITTPNGEVFFNTTGNPGMATGGSGDVLTGIITGLLAQGYFPLEAAKAGCFIHGLAGDIAVAAKGEHALIASDIIDCISDAYLNLLIG